MSSPRGSFGYPFTKKCDDGSRWKDGSIATHCCPLHSCLAPPGLPRKSPSFSPPSPPLRNWRNVLINGLGATPPRPFRGWKSPREAIARRYITGSLYDALLFLDSLVRAPNICIADSFWGLTRESAQVLGRPTLGPIS